MSAPVPHPGAPENSSPAPKPGPAPGTEDMAAAAEQSVNAALSGLDGLGDLAVGEHVRRFDAVHTALTDALTSADNMLSGSTGNGG